MSSVNCMSSAHCRWLWWTLLLLLGTLTKGQIPLTPKEWDAVRLRQRLHNERRGQASRLAERVGTHVPLPDGPWVQSASDVKVAGNHLCATLRSKGQDITEDCSAVEEGYEFANRRGELRTAENLPLCENTCVYFSNGRCDDGGPGSTYSACRYGTDCDDCGKRPVFNDLPGGDWNDTARDITLEGRQLCAHLQRFNLSWNFVCTVVEDGQRFTNLNGHFYLIGQECWVLRCPIGYVQKSLDNITDTLCTGKTCHVEIDRDLCCEAAEPCSSIECPEGAVFDIHRFCPSTQCVQDRDMDLCCVDAAICSTLDCGYGYVSKANVSSLYCLGPDCDLARDLEICCDEAAPCGDFVNFSIADCPEGYFLDPDILCAGAECVAERDMFTCCQESALCSNFTCPGGYVLRGNATEIACPRYDCTVALDTDRCCEFRAPCSSLSCPPTFVLKDGASTTYCAGAECSLEDDFGTCCEAGQLCGNTTFDGSCVEGYYINPDRYCYGVPCLETRDLVPGICCDDAEPCNGTVSCPLGLTLRAGSGPAGYTFCTGPACAPDGLEDITACCTEAAHCRTLPSALEEMDSNETNCPFGYVLRNFTDEPDQYCDGISCELPRDLDVCCEPAGVCADEFTCPSGYVAKTEEAYCTGAVGSCNMADDRDLCCDVAESCVNYPVACPQNYVLRPLQFCLATSCEEDRDKFECCAIGVAFQHYRFNTTKLRDGPGNGYVIQMAEMAFYFDGAAVSLSTATVTVEGTSDSPDGEGPENIADENVNTKWLDKSTAVPSLLISFTDDNVIDTYTWVTANDISGRDPVAWVFQGSIDGNTWVDLHIVEEGDVTVPTDRLAYLDVMEVGVPCLAYELVIQNASDPPCLEGGIIPSGSGCTASCNGGLTPTPANLACAHGELAPTEFVCG